MSGPKGAETDSKDKDNAAYQKRREQVRRAQRTHRERKETYIKTLENEVLQLRTNKTRTAQGTRALLAEVEKMRHVLDHHGILYENSFNYALFSQISETSSHPSPSLVYIGQDQAQTSDCYVGSPPQGSGSEFNLSESEGPCSMPVSRNLRRRGSQPNGRDHAFQASTPEGYAWGHGHTASNTATEMNLLAIDQRNDNAARNSFDSPGFQQCQTLIPGPSRPIPCPLDGHISHSYSYTQHPMNVAIDSPSPAWSPADHGLEKLFYSQADLQMGERTASASPWVGACVQREYVAIREPGLPQRAENMPECYGTPFSGSEEMELWPVMN